MSLKKTLEEYKDKGIYPFHMPGHKRNLAGDCYEIDMTEVEGVDDLHDPEGPIFEDQKRLAKIYGADESYILVGGSTVGNLAAVYAAINEGDRVLIQRNSHKSVYNALTLRHALVSYIDSKTDENGIYEAVKLDDIKSAIDKEENIKAVVITSPTYEGYHCDIEKIAETCHGRGAILVVDQAHGAHLGMEEVFCGSAVKYADLTIMSLHKTLPSLTQTAVLHKSGNRVDSRRIREALDMFETSSPSYVLMNSVSCCIDTLENGGEKFKSYVDKLADFYSQCSKLKHLKVISEDYKTKDPGKLVISTKHTNISGNELAEILRKKYLIETELSSFCYVIAMTSIMDSKEGFNRLLTALLEIDDSLESSEQAVPQITIEPVKKMELYEAKKGEEKVVMLQEAEGEISSGMICIYPPGSPIVVPGEEITRDALLLIKNAREKGLHVTGVSGDRVSVVN